MPSVLRFESLIISEFDRRVYRAVSKVPVGMVTTYELATYIIAKHNLF